MNGQYVADGINIGATVVAPGAGVVVAGLAAPPVGEYEIRFAVAVGAGALAADNGNVKLNFNGAIQLASVPTTGNEFIIPRITLNGSNVVQLVAVGAATAGVPYSGRITVTQLD